MPSVLLEDLSHHVLELQLPGGPGTEEVGQEVPTAVPGPNYGPRGARLLTEGHIQTMEPHSHSQGPGPMIPDADISGASPVLRRGIVSQRRETVSQFPR